MAIRFEQVSKQYTIGQGDKPRNTTLRDALTEGFSKAVRQLQSKKDIPSAKPDRNTRLLALDKVSFDIEQGERVGIIGRNGAGKSTLLKILSRITEPSSGRIGIRGRVASLLEVGTGFHPELTGRENIFLNGAILGLKKREVKARFDEIVDFSEVERFLDTPVKHYSSGMYARLAFAVAAHLESDVLVVDEVLAVGDAQFQRKCLGKMNEIAGPTQRTLLFVSHNMQAVQNLCSRALFLEEGRLIADDAPMKVIRTYLGSGPGPLLHRQWASPAQAPGNEFIRLKQIGIRPQTADTEYPDRIDVHTPIEVCFEFWNYLDKGTLNVNVKLFTATGECVFDMGSPGIPAETGLMALGSLIPGNLLNNNRYMLGMTVVRDNHHPLCDFSHLVAFDVEDVRQNMDYYGSWPGIIRPPLHTWLYKLAEMPA